MPESVNQTNTDFSAEDRSLDSVYSDLQRNTWAGGNILRGEIPRIVVVTALPTATAERRNQIVVKAGAALATDIPYVCIKNDSDTYEWLQLGGAIVTQTATTDLKDAMVANDIIADSGASPLDLDGGKLTCGEANITGAINHDGTTVGWFSTTPTTKQTVTGSRGANAALATLLDALRVYGLITDSSTI